MRQFLVRNVLLIMALASCATANYHAANMTLMSGQVVALDVLYQAANWTCCVPRSVLGDYTPVVRLDSSGGQYYVTRDPKCKQVIDAADYPATYEAIYMCGKDFQLQSRCQNGGCPTVDGGLSLALPGDWCVDANNTQDPMVLCSTAAPVCDAGYSGKCIALADDAIKPVSDAPSMTLQSGLVVNINELQHQYWGQCCLPRSVLSDYTPVIRFDNTDGKYFVSNDASCSDAITNSMYPAMYEYVWVCGDRCPSGGCSDGSSGAVDGGVVLVPAGGTCDPYNYYSSGCWGSAPMCSFANQCIGISYYDYNWDSTPYGWGHYRPSWWRPLSPIYRPYWRQPTRFFDHPDDWRAGWNRRPENWVPGGHIDGWRPGHRPDDWEPHKGWRPRSDWQPGMSRGGKRMGPIFNPSNDGDGDRHDLLPGTRSGPGVILPYTPGRSSQNPGSGGWQSSRPEDPADRPGNAKGAGNPGRAPSGNWGNLFNPGGNAATGQGSPDSDNHPSNPATVGATGHDSAGRGQYSGWGNWFNRPTSANMGDSRPQTDSRNVFTPGQLAISTPTQQPAGANPSFGNSGNRPWVITPPAGNAGSMNWWSPARSSLWPPGVGGRTNTWPGGQSLTPGLWSTGSQTPQINLTPVHTYNPVSAIRSTPRFSPRNTRSFWPQPSSHYTAPRSIRSPSFTGHLQPSYHTQRSPGSYSWGGGRSSGYGRNNQWLWPTVPRAGRNWGRGYGGRSSGGGRFGGGFGGGRRGRKLAAV